MTGTQNALLKADLHVHTTYSPDSCMTPEKIIRRCLQRGINCLAITDHNAVAGAMEVQRLAPFPVIVGEEIKTTSGEIIGLFLKERIPRGLSPSETVVRIKEQGGLVCLPHPFDTLRRHSAWSRPGALDSIMHQIDIIEVFNARSLLQRNSDRARRLAQDNGFLASAGSDAHTLWEIGRTYVEMPPFDSPESFKTALKRGQVHGRRTGMWIHFITMFILYRRKLVG